MSAPVERVCIVGSGNWGSAIARIVGENVYHFDKFEKEVNMWVFEELIEGRKLTDIINTDHENVKYLPGFKLPENVKAVPSLKDAVVGATLLIFVLPHQFLPRLFADIRAGLGEETLASGRVKGISLIKGIDYDDKGLVLISDTIRKGLGIDMAVLMGANVAAEVAERQFCEATVGCTSPTSGELWKDVFDTDYFRIAVSLDAATVELCGALKNVVALAAGWCDGLGFGSNTKAAIMRIGLTEMRRFCETFYGSTQPDTYFESCGVADLITTCFSGRNRKVAEAFARTGADWDKLEAEMLGGQKLQGTLTAVEVYHVLETTGKLHAFPLFNVIYRIMRKELPAKAVVDMHFHVPREEHVTDAAVPAEHLVAVEVEKHAQERAAALAAAAAHH